MPSRTFGNAARYGFNGKERDKDLHSLTAYDYGFRIYNPAIGRFLSVDPLTKKYPELTAYQFASNTPILAIDLDGLELSVKLPDGTFYTPSGCDRLGFKYPNGGKLMGVTNGGKGFDDMCKFINGEVFTRIGGVFRTASGILIMAGTWESIWTPWGAGAFAFGTDQGATGLREIWYGAPQESMAEQLQEDVGVPKNDARNITDLAAGYLSLSPISEAKPPIFNPIIKTVTSQKNAAVSEKQLETGLYKDMIKKYANTGKSSDHIPSFASLRRYVESSIGVQLTKDQQMVLRQNSLTLVYETEIHETMSRTFAGRNNANRILSDANDLVGAIRKDIESLTPGLIKAGYSASEILSAQAKLQDQLMDNLNKILFNIRNQGIK